MTTPYTGDGKINYRFYASDGTDDATGTPTSDKAVTLSAPAGNAKPSLSWASANCLSNGVRPATGVEGTDFEFMVTYKDADNQCPTDILLWLDENDNGIYEGDEKYVLEAGAGDCQNGKIYKKTISLITAGNGNLKYRSCDRWMKRADGLPTSDSSVTVLNAVKVRPTGGEGWYSSIQAAVNASPDPSTILVYPNSDFTAATYSETVLLNNEDNRSIISACGPDLTTIASPDTGTTITVQDSSNFVLDGFSITGATSGMASL
jgi:hypothetical protein